MPMPPACAGTANFDWIMSGISEPRMMKSMTSKK